MASRVVQAGRGLFYIGLESYAELETLLAALRAEGIAIDELALEETDLEQVFLRIMKAPEGCRHERQGRKRGCR